LFWQTSDMPTSFGDTLTIVRIDGQKSSGTEMISGTGNDDWIYPLGGSDIVDGRGGYDTVVVAWESTNFKITSISSTTYLDAISGASSADKVTLLNVEAIQFPDKTLPLVEDMAFTNNPGSEVFQGGWGVDGVRYSGPRADFTVVQDASGIDVQDTVGNTGTDRLVRIERVHFQDISLAYDTTGRAGTVMKTLGAVFGQDVARNPDYAGIALHYLDDKSYSATQLIGLALEARLGPLLQDANAVVNLLYTNVVGAAPDAATLSSFVQLIASGQYSAVSLAMMAAETELNQVRVGLTGQLIAPLEYHPQDS